MMWNRGPYTEFHFPNIDIILDKVKEIAAVAKDAATTALEALRRAGVAQETANNAETLGERANNRLDVAEPKIEENTQNIVDLTQTVTQQGQEIRNLDLDVDNKIRGLTLDVVTVQEDVASLDSRVDNLEYGDDQTIDYPMIAPPIPIKDKYESVPLETNRLYSHTEFFPPHPLMSPFYLVSILTPEYPDTPFVLSVVASYSADDDLGILEIRKSNFNDGPTLAWSFNISYTVTADTRTSVTTTDVFTIDNGADVVLATYTSDDLPTIVTVDTLITGGNGNHKFTSIGHSIGEFPRTTFSRVLTSYTTTYVTYTF